LFPGYPIPGHKAAWKSDQKRLTTAFKIREELFLNLEQIRASAFGRKAEEAEARFLSHSTQEGQERRLFERGQGEHEAAPKALRKGGLQEGSVSVAEQRQDEGER
jgi:hypothetical protein